MWWIPANTPGPLQSGMAAAGQSSSLGYGPRRPSPHPAAPSDKGYDCRMRPPTSRLTRRQWLYMVGIQGVISMLVAAVVNFSISYALYSSSRPPPGPPPPGSHPPHLFRLPTSLVADAALSSVFQTLATWYVLAYMVNRDLSRGELQPTAPLRGRLAREPTGGFLRWFLFLDHYNAERGSRLLGGIGRTGWRMKLALALAGAGRALMVTALAYGFQIGPAIGILVPLGTPDDGDWMYTGRWFVPAFKTIFGALMGFWTAPVLTWMWMVRAAWIFRRHEGLPF
ncbi:hypothetical protein N658DRAFT_505628 [Parathielavia hyrcaniae]|uniref:Uncharacterized protein n=1 Tax=Parathielavia hyrcaniae TaxID=113614 RepID=A0AAN6Q6S1_9PEZI|nr:hypothetical protein N658DRAFT_505628 [Parathielavia hyrcaniae]